jgi:hypothetical protein
MYVCIFGGLFLGIPAVLGIAIVYEYLHRAGASRNAASLTKIVY